MATVTTTTRIGGWGAALALLVLLGGCIAWRAARSSSLASEGRSAVESYLVAEAQRNVLDSAGATLEKVTKGDIAAGLAAGQALLRAHQITVRSLGAHGYGDTLHVRVAYAFGNDAVEQVEYLRATKSLAAGWRVVGRSSAFAYHTRL